MRSAPAESVIARAMQDYFGQYQIRSGQIRSVGIQGQAMQYHPDRNPDDKESEEKFKEFDADNRIWWGKNDNSIPQIKRFLSEVKQGRVPQTLWPYSEVGHTQDAKKELLAICDFADSPSVFITPKPTKLLRRILEVATDKDSKLENVKAIGEIKKGDWADITYSVAGGKNVAKMVSVEKEEPAAEENAPADTAAE